MLLADQDVVLGGGSLLDARWMAWREKLCGALSDFPTVRTLAGTALLGAYGHGVFAALQSLAPAEAARLRGCERGCASSV